MGKLQIQLLKGGGFKGTNSTDILLAIRQLLFQFLKISLVNDVPSVSDRWDQVNPYSRSHIQYIRPHNQKVIVTSL